MLLSERYHKLLIDRPWHILRANSQVYYLKYLFEEHEYLILITDLRLVWFELGDYKRIQRNAQVPSIDIETEREAATVLVRVRTLFEENLTRLKIDREPSVLKLNCHPQQTKKITTFSWVFNCDLLAQQKSQEEENDKTGPDVIFDHFILPSQTIVNHFIDKMADDDNNQIKSRANNYPTSLYSKTTLDYMSHLINQSGSTTFAVTQDGSAISLPSSTSSSFELAKAETSHIMTEEELEAKRKLDLRRLAQEEKQRNPSLNKKRRRF
ncbi:hypothetical protein A0J61_04810 [Choanephora cucurbitarum]|uniref:Non-homologous end-joining factor 1 n=1 Tax=Choanephora cucurbitarum TaxID=101091 RepID=A0A1C7NDJ9_9FUNG|nr:hypothetical protein A0J61_04810 [Choanephora cucurbitarum]